MARPQNVVNGNTNQQPYTYLHHGFNINSQVPQLNNQNVYGYPDIQQVLSNHYVPQVYPGSLNHNIVNSIRPNSPLVNQAQYAYFPYPSAQFGQYQYSSNFLPTQSYPYTQEPQNTPVNNNPPTSRKSIPLVITDPTNNTDLDLSKFQSQPIPEVKIKPLAESKKLDNIEEDKEEEIKEFEVEGITPDEFLEKEPNEKVVAKERKLEEIIEEETKEIIDIEENNPEKEQKHEEDVVKIESSNDSTDADDDSITASCNNAEDDELTLTDGKETKSYFIQINKKESDETTLMRKLIYDREYLITLKSNVRCQRKPTNLVENGDLSEIIYNESQNISCNKPDGHKTGFFKNNKRQTQRPLSTNIRSDVKSFQPKLINLDTKESRVFERQKSSYLPPQLRSKEHDADTLDELKRNIKCNLNKITPQNFQDCLSEISKLNIHEKEEMSCLINEIFIKAVQEEAYSVTYAQFCNKLSSMYTENQSFKGQLLKKCQDMFQTPIQDQLENVRKDWMLKIDNEQNPKMKALYESDLGEQVKKAKDKYFGNIRFIGELFLHQLLAGKVILNCIVELLKAGNDIDALLALCKLMETCGKQIDDRHKQQMDVFIGIIDELSKSVELETRIRFKLRDISDMRKRQWTLRHIQQAKKINPKTLEEQKEEAMAEAALKHIMVQSSFKKPQRSVPQNAVRRHISAPQKSLAVKNLSCISHIVDNKTVLGPVSHNWTAGSGLKPRAQKESDEWTSLPTKYTTSSRSRELSPQVRLTNKYGTLESSADVSDTDSRSSSPIIAYPNNLTKAYRIKDRKLSINDTERGEILFNDLMLTGHFDVASWLHLHDTEPIIEKWIDGMMEKDASCRRSVGNTFFKLMQDNIISSELLIKCLQNFLSDVDDLICDIPKLWQFFAQFLECFIQDKGSNIDFFQHVFKAILPNRDVALCISMTLHAASSRLGHNVVGEVFHESALQWSNIIGNNWQQFVDENNLGFTIVGVAPVSSVTSRYSLVLISSDLATMLSNDSSNEDIFGYLEQHVDITTLQSSECTRIVTSCVLSAMINQPRLLVRDYLKEKSDIIRHVCQKKIDNEVVVLTSILNVADKLDYEILTIIYDVILTEEIVSNAAFDAYFGDVSYRSEPNFESTFQIISQLYVPNDYQL